MMKERPFDAKRAVPTVIWGAILRVQAPGLLGQTYRVAFNRGETRTHRVSLGDNLLTATESVECPTIVPALPFGPPRCDFIEWTSGWPRAGIVGALIILARMGSGTRRLVQGALRRRRAMNPT